MALNSYLNEEEKKKRKPRLLSEITNMMPGAQRGQETGRMISDAYNKGGLLSAAGMGLRRAPGDILTGVGDFVNKGIVQPTNRVLAAPINALADIGKTVFTGEVEPTGAKIELVPTVQDVQHSNSQKPKAFTSGAESKLPELYEPATKLSLPTINEVPNAQRDAELGKINVSTDGDTTTYNIDGNKISYNLSEKDKQIKSNLERINQMIASGIKVSPEQMERINNIRQQAGYLRGGTDEQMNNPQANSRLNNLDVEFDPSVSPEARARFLENPVAPVAQMARFDAYQNTPRGRYFGATPMNETSPQDVSIGETFMQGIQTRKDKAASQIANDAEARNIDRANLLNLTDRNQIERSKLLLDADANRLNELDIRSQNKLRDIQGQVAQQPPIKENALKPMVIEEVDPNDLTGITKRQRIMIPNPEGNGYVDGMTKQAATAQLTPDQKAKAVAYAKANPNIDKAVILQKIANGEI